MAKLRPQRGEADLGRRSGGRAARWAGESEPDDGHRREPRRPAGACSTNCRRPTAKRSARSTACLVGLQLTHSGRFCKPNDHKKFEPRIAYHHPLLDEKYHLDPNDDSLVFTDAELDQLADDYVAAAHLAAEVGFQFVDVKACHGYLLHEFLSARRRPGQIRRRPGRAGRG